MPKPGQGGIVEANPATRGAETRAFAPANRAGANHPTPGAPGGLAVIRGNRGAGRFDL